MQSSESKQIGRMRRHNRIRARVVGATARPRLAVYKSNRYLHAQIIDDSKGVTLLSGSTKEVAKNSKKMEAARLLGAHLAKKATDAGIAQVVFDRGGFRYTGRVAQMAEAARAGGLQF